MRYYGFSSCNRKFNVSIGENCIINNKALLEHDVKIGDNVHISTGCIVNGFFYWSNTSRK